MTPDEDTLLNVKTMFLTNVASDVSESTIRDACEKYGSLHKINYARRDKGFVYVEYNNRNDCLRAIDNLHNTKLGSQYITTALAKPKVKTPLGLTPSDSRLAGTLPYGARVRGYGRGAELMGTTLLPFGAAMGSYGRSVGGAVGASVIADRGYARRLDSRPQPYDIRSSTRTDRSDRTTDREKRSYTSSTRSRDALTPSSYREWDGVYDYTRYEPSYVHAAAAVSGAYDSNAYAHLQAYYSNPSYKTH
ncbi:RNA-binding protein Rsf1-like isoform X3 [Zophobas morio]|uniref:RNA-binding protein Rsf1-like isoform X3 n=1 Tax=Zophobas morio TaxID=2755281 RepID=UPI0030829B91